MLQLLRIGIFLKRERIQRKVNERKIVFYTCNFSISFFGGGGGGGGGGVEGMWIGSCFYVKLENILGGQLRTCP